MTQLSCSVASCRYNEDDCCCRNEIMVNGQSATSSQETCCESFEERTANSVSNRTGSPEKETEIGCKAKKCVHNENEQCSASGIGVSGRSACCCSETECETFQCR